MLRDDAILIDIANAAKLTRQFIQNLDKDKFFIDLKTQSAVLHQLIIIGEAVKRLSTEFRGLHPEIPWSEIAGMRNKIIHEYNSVDLEAVWQVVSDDIDELISAITPLLPKKKE